MQAQELRCAGGNKVSLGPRALTGGWANKQGVQAETLKIGLKQTTLTRPMLKQNKPKTTWKGSSPHLTINLLLSHVSFLSSHLQSISLFFTHSSLSHLYFILFTLKKKQQKKKSSSPSGFFHTINKCPLLCSFRFKASQYTLLCFLLSLPLLNELYFSNNMKSTT